VDDLIITGSSSSLIQNVQQALMEQFDMTDLGLLHYFLGLQVLQSSEGIFIFQQKYALDLLQCFGMVDCKLTPTPFSQVSLFLPTSLHRESIHRCIDNWLGVYCI
jgi:hypothetical protein